MALMSLCRSTCIGDMYLLVGIVPPDIRRDAEKGAHTSRSCCPPTPLLVGGGGRSSRLRSIRQLLHPSVPSRQVGQRSAYVGAVEEMMCVVCVTEGA